MSDSEMCPQSINRHNWSGRCNCAKAAPQTGATSLGKALDCT